MNNILNFIKNNSLILLTITGIVALGTALNNLVPWQYLTYFFVILRHLIQLIDFIIPANQLIAVIGAGLSVALALWSYKGYIWIIEWYKNH